MDGRLCWVVVYESVIPDYERRGLRARGKRGAKVDQAH